MNCDVLSAVAAVRLVATSLHLWLKERCVERRSPRRTLVIYRGSSKRRAVFSTKLEDSNNPDCHNSSVTYSARSSSMHRTKTVDRHTFGGTSKATLLPPVVSLPLLLLLLAFISCAKSTAGDGKPNWLLSEVVVEEEEDDDDGDPFVPGTSKGGA